MNFFLKVKSQLVLYQKETPMLLSWIFIGALVGSVLSLVLTSILSGLEENDDTPPHMVEKKPTDD